MVESPERGETGRSIITFAQAKLAIVMHNLRRGYEINLLRRIDFIRDYFSNAIVYPSLLSQGPSYSFPDRYCEHRDRARLQRSLVLFKARSVCNGLRSCAAYRVYRSGQSTLGVNAVDD